MSNNNNPQISFVSKQYKSTNKSDTLQIKKAISPDRHTPCSHKYLCNRSKGCMTKIPIFVECTKSE